MTMLDGWAILGVPIHVYALSGDAKLCGQCGQCGRCGRRIYAGRGGVAVLNDRVVDYAQLRHTAVVSPLAVKSR